VSSSQLTVGFCYFELITCLIPTLRDKFEDEFEVEFEV
jgi:hypothetical protein